jgi:hypothetical protein
MADIYIKEIDITITDEEINEVLLRHRRAKSKTDFAKLRELSNRAKENNPTRSDRKRL